MTPQRPFVDREIAEQAVELQRPSIEAALRVDGVSGLGVLHVVVLNPARRSPEATFEQALLYEHSFGPRERWDVDYAAYARAKAKLSWKHQMDSRRLLTLEPQRLGDDDPFVWGSVWLDGLVVAASGAMPWWDEAFSLAIAGTVRALVLERVDRGRQAN